MRIPQMWLIGWALCSLFSALVFVWWNVATKKRLQRARVDVRPAIDFQASDKRTA